MNKSALSSAVALVLGSASGTASALSMDITNMSFGPDYSASGTLTDTGTFGSMSSIAPFFSNSWTADAQAYFSNQPTQQQNWAGTAGTDGSWDFTFTLGDNQVAWGTLFSWSTSSNIAVLNIMECTQNSGTDSTTGAICTGVAGQPMQNGPFVTSDPLFTGSLNTGTITTVPVPAAVWLMGSGLVGLAGVARRKKKA